MNNSIVRVSHLDAFIGEKQILKDISFEVPFSQVVGIAGPSGGGKSTLLYSLSALLDMRYQLKGEIVYKNQENILELNAKRSRQMASSQCSMILQQAMSSLDPYEKIFTQLQEVLFFKESTPKENILSRIQELFKDVSLEHEQGILEKYPHQLSGGMAQRITLALALIGHPKILLADEPTSSMDAIYQLSFIQTLARLSQEKKTTILFVSHDVALLSQFCDRILILDQGILVEDQKMSDYLRQPHSAMGRELLLNSRKLGNYENLTSIKYI